MSTRTDSTPKEVAIRLRAALRNRPDLGLRKLITDSILESVNPFEPKARRKPQKWFVLACLLTLSAAGSFIFFNLK